MDTLFRLPRPKRITVSLQQLMVMDLVLLRDGEPLGPIPDGWKVSLRRLLIKGLVKCVVLGPAIYVITPIGRVVRGRK